MKRPTNAAKSSDTEEHQVIGARLREAREFLGLNQEDVAQALIIPRASISALESGKRRVSGLELRRLARLYRRTTAWLLGVDEPPIGADDALYRATAELSDGDREQVLRFAEFLAANERLAKTASEGPQSDG